MALEKETKRQSSLVLEERLRWRESLKDQRKELVERYVDERRLTSNTKPNLVNLFSNQRYKTHTLDQASTGFLESEKFLNRNIFGYANDSDDDNDYGYYVENRKETKPLSGILSKFIIDPKVVKKVKSEDDVADSNELAHEVVDNQGTFRLIDALFLLGPHDDDVNRVCLTNPLSSVTERVEPHNLFECGIVPGVETEVLPFFSFPSGVEVITSSSGSTKRPIKNHAFVLASHTYSQYAICMVVPRTFKDPTNPTSDRLITTEYCICVVTRLPFINYIIHILHRSELMGWIFPNLTEPIQANDSPGNIIPPILYSLNDLANRLKRIKVLFEIPEDVMADVEDYELKHDSIEFTLQWLGS